MRKGIDKGVELVYNKGVGAAGDGCFLAEVLKDNRSVWKSGAVIFFYYDCYYSTT